MPPKDDLNNLLKENLEISRESFKILKSIQRGNRIGAILKFLYWAIIVGSAVGAYYYLQPFLMNTVDMYRQAFGLSSDLQNGGIDTDKNTDKISDIIKNLSPDAIKKLQNSLNKPE